MFPSQSVLHGDVVVLTTQGWITGIGLGHLRGESMIQLPQSGVEAHRLLKQSLPRVDYRCWLLVLASCVLCVVCCWLCVVGYF